ncbi:hypothetical protein CXQ85_004428 [Candidozyma haemuli]|uniref:ubiquitinyl hydrolase 1 n=1 Tax=Candidozyma haemuli TaxID=45357 RepID=A0A2V1ASY7_9ASCO|nr:hypothetical protein CXQ85_004428 [[Candida] haemuloni]PVH20915.1 hypothetical protein CXQ85_004428 [[Candida] haemuloni]
MSVFDLIDHCSTLFEESKEHIYTSSGLKSYIRAYLIFNYFINSFIMDIIGRNVFDVDLDSLQSYMDEYLTSHKLLSFDIQELFGWLNEYIEFLKHKDDDSEEEEDDDDFGQEISAPAVSKPYYQTEPTNSLNLSDIIRQGDPADQSSDVDMSDFANRFPEVATDSELVSETPYPVRLSRSSLAEPPLHNNRQNDGLSQNNVSQAPYSMNQRHEVMSQPPLNPPKHISPPYATPYEKLAAGPSVVSLPPNGQSMAYGNNGNAFHFQNRSHVQLPDRQAQYQQHGQTYQHHYMSPQVPQPHQFNSHPMNHINGTYSAPYQVASSLKPGFNIPFEQQDAQEFLLFVIDKVHEELARPPSEEALQADYVTRWGVDVTPREKEEYLKWYRSLMKAEGVSPMNDLCQGHVRSQLICNKCGCTSNSYSSFSMLSLPIPNLGRDMVDLVECLRYFSQDEVLSGDNAWKCPRCNKSDGEGNPMDVVFQQKKSLKPWKNRNSSKKSKESVDDKGPITIKKLSIIKLPPVLFIHLSRFSMFSVTDKLNAVISYPLRLKFNHQTGDVHYSLTGLINHFGNLKSGHYTSLVNKSKDSSDRLLNPEWCYLDDENFRLHVRSGQPSSFS